MRTSTKTSVSALDAHLGFWLRYVSNQVSGRFQAQLEQQDCSVSEWVAVRTLYNRPAISHAQLIQALGMTKGATSKVLSRLQQRGLVKRTLAEGSNREQLLELTAKGKNLVPRLAALADANDEHFFGNLSAAERGALFTALKKLVAEHNLPGPPVY